MNTWPAVCCIVLLLSVFPAGCMTSFPTGQDGMDNSGSGLTVTPLENPLETTTPPPPSLKNAAVNASAIPLLLTDSDWQIAEGCGWTEKNIPESAALLMDSCTAKTLLRDGWTVVGMRYGINVLGSPCRRSTHPEAPEDCDWCADSGPTLILRYKGILETELMAHMKEQSVTRFRTRLPEDSGSRSSGDSDTVMFHNGTIVYSFRNC